MATVYYTTLSAMATRFSLVIPGLSRKPGENIAMLIQSELNRLENLLNPYNRESVLYKVNQQAPFHEMETGEELFMLLKKCYQFWQDTGGLFDISMLGKKQLLKQAFLANNAGKHEHNHAGSNQPVKINFVQKKQKFETPLETPESTSKTDRESGMRFILFKEENKSVRFLSPDVQIDPGAFGKGYALDCIWKLLETKNIPDAFVSFGESSIMGRGHHPSGNHWQVSLNIPGSKENECVLSLEDAFVSVSGFLPKPSDTNGQQEVHIMDPRTGTPQNFAGIVAVVAKSGLEAEALSTALYLAEPQTYSAILPAFSCSSVYRLTYDQQGRISSLQLHNLLK